MQEGLTSTLCGGGGGWVRSCPKQIAYPWAYEKISYLRLQETERHLGCRTRVLQVIDDNDVTMMTIVTTCLTTETPPPAWVNIWGWWVVWKYPKTNPHRGLNHFFVCRLCWVLRVIDKRAGDARFGLSSIPQVRALPESSRKLTATQLRGAGVLMAHIGLRSIGSGDVEGACLGVMWPMTQ